MFTPDYRNIVNAAKNKVSARIPVYEHIISPDIMEIMLGKKFAQLYDGDAPLRHRRPLQRGF